MGTEASQRGPEVAKQCAWLITGIAIAYWVRLVDEFLSEKHAEPSID